MGCAANIWGWISTWEHAGDDRSVRLDRIALDGLGRLPSSVSYLFRSRVDFADRSIYLQHCMCCYANPVGNPPRPNHSSRSTITGGYNRYCFFNRLCSCGWDPSNYVGILHRLLQGERYIQTRNCIGYYWHSHLKFWCGVDLEMVGIGSLLETTLNLDKFYQMEWKRTNSVIFQYKVKKGENYETCTRCH